MQKAILFAAIIFLTTFSSCEKTDCGSMTVVRDCTGTYLRLDGKDYHVCNPEKVTSYAEGTVLKVNYKRIDDCNGSAKDEIVCMMLHACEGWIEVEKVK